MIPPTKTLPEGCQCPSDRNLVICIDGTANQFSESNTNVIELYNRLKKSKNQLTYYNSGIGTYVKEGKWWLSSDGWKQFYHHGCDMAFATNFKNQVLSAYQWLSEVYNEGDRIFLFGFSRGAYQVRVIAGMIEKVGLLHRGNNPQIPFAYELYVKNTESERRIDRTEPHLLCTRFKNVFSRPGVKVHFVGAWDTVSSIGILKGTSLPETTTGMKHVCFFRHALALDELRVKFLPEYVNGGEGPDVAGEKTQQVKEVWFAGTHSDIGGGNSPNLELNHFGPSLRWMSYEAIRHGLEMEHQGQWSPVAPKPESLGLFYRFLEWIPLPHLSYRDVDSVVWRPHLSGPRKLQRGQLIHESVFREMDNDNYRPKACFFDEEIQWVPENLEARGMVEKDPYTQAGHLITQFEKTNLVSKEDFDAFHMLAETDRGCYSITQVPNAARIFIATLCNEFRRSEVNSHWKTEVIKTLVKVLVSFEQGQFLSSDGSSQSLRELLPELEKQYPELMESCRRLRIVFREVGVPVLSQRFFSVIIGIGNYCYTDLPKLYGCVADAHIIADFFVEKLGMPRTNVSMLCDEGATRSNIIDRIRSLAHNDAIQWGDPIIIYYAGFASRVNLPTAWGIDEQTSLLHPYDSLRDHMTCISDRTLYQLLSEIAYRKGNNITVILDCCHAGNFVDRSYQHQATSPVFLAATSKNEMSYEVAGHGQFTKELSKVLHGLDSPVTATYQDVIELLPDLRHGQTPQCRGDYSRILFANERPTRRGMYYRIRKVGNEALILEAGEVQGITENACFDVYDTTHEDAKFLCSVVATEVLQFSTHVDVHDGNNGKTGDPADFAIRLAAWALQTHAGRGTDMSVIVADDALSRLVSERANETSRLGNQRVRVVGMGEECDLKVVVVEDQFVFNIFDKHGVASLYFPVNIDLYGILERAADFFWHLRRSNETSKLVSFITVKAWLLTDSDENIGMLVPAGDNLIVNGTIHMRVKNGAKTSLGFVIESTARVPLYVWIFSFNLSELRIDNIYKPAFAKQGDADPCLSPGQLLTFTNSLYLPPGHDSNISYLKIFFTRKYVDLSHVEIPAHGRAESLSSSDWGIHRGTAPPPPWAEAQLPHSWGTLLIPIVQKRND